MLPNYTTISIKFEIFFDTSNSINTIYFLNVVWRVNYLIVIFLLIH
ncbi:hypothetical protein rpr22_CDSx524 [Rickettsia prowazekii str. Rp22]|uniref:Uncharacterized protein n=1 Tax=Rickettsia prowazekii (strain Rp22) TaxID=449216 RepID=D5AX84_RICPP|nr:hypothetical protein rpr22_CDSx524 [Rickettsia prowazekii str. Rp22]